MASNTGNSLFMLNKDPTQTGTSTTISRYSIWRLKTHESLNTDSVTEEEEKSWTLVAVLLELESVENWILGEREERERAAGEM